MKVNKPCLQILVCLAIVLLALPAFAAEEKKDAWEYGAITGQIRYYYFKQRDKPEGSSTEQVKESLALGGFLKYETPWVSDMLQAGVAGFTSQPFPSDFNKKDKAGTLMLDSNNQGITVLGEAYLKLKAGPALGSFYRQRIETPFLNSNDSRMIPHTYEAYVIQSHDLEDLTLQGGWVDKVKLRDTPNFKSMSNVSGNAAMAGTRRGMLMAGADWSPDPVDTRFWYYNIPNYLQIAYGEAGATHELGDDMSWFWLGQIVDQRDVGDSDGGSFNAAELGVLGGLTVNGFKMEVGGTIVDNSTDIVNKWGNYPFFNNMMSYAFNRAGEKALFLGLTYDFERINWTGFSSSLKASLGDTPDSGRNASPDRNEYNLNFNYNFDGNLKGLSILNRWSYQESRGEKDGFQVRLRFQYNFQLL